MEAVRGGGGCEEGGGCKERGELQVEAEGEGGAASGL